MRGRAQVYNPSTANAWKHAVAAAAAPHAPPEPLEGPVAMRLVLHFKRPQRLLRRASPDGVVWHTIKPDIDNCAKAVIDAMTRADSGRILMLARRALSRIGFWRDDCQVCWQDARKVYAARNQPAGADIHVWSVRADAGECIWPSCERHPGSRS